MPRIAPLSQGQGSPFARVVLRQATKRFGRKPESIAIKARHGALLAGEVGYELALERAGRVPTALKELATVKAASVAGCAFCLDISSWLAATHGVTDEQLRAITHHRDADVFTETERLVIDYADAMSRTPVQVPEELFAALRGHFDDEQLLELTAAIAWENHRARFNAALAVEAQGFTEGAVCAAPDVAATSAA